MKLGHDPFARVTIGRESVAACGATCAWCGQVRRHVSKLSGLAVRSPTLFRYYVEDDARAGRNYFKGGFCSIGCLNAYHGGD